MDPNLKLSEALLAVYKNRLIIGFLGKNNQVILGRISEPVYINNNGNLILLGLRIHTGRHSIYVPFDTSRIIYL